MNIYSILFKLDMYGYAYHLTISEKRNLLLFIFQKDRIVDIEWSNAKEVHSHLYERKKSNRKEDDRVTERNVPLFDIIKKLSSHRNYSILRLNDKGISILVTSPVGKHVITVDREGDVEDILYTEKKCILDSEDDLFYMLEKLPIEWGGEQTRKIYEHMNKKEDYAAKMKSLPVRSIYDLLGFLESRQIWYEIGHYSPDVITVHITPGPGERIEVDCADDGEMTIARFRGDEVAEQSIDELIIELNHENDVIM